MHFNVFYSIFFKTFVFVQEGFKVHIFRARRCPNPWLVGVGCDMHGYLPTGGWYNFFEEFTVGNFFVKFFLLNINRRISQNKPV